MERGIRKRGRRERQSNGLREGESEDWVVMVLACVKMTVKEIEHLSIFSNENQSVKQLSIRIWAGVEFSALIWCCNILSNNTTLHHTSCSSSEKQSIKISIDKLEL